MSETPEIKNLDQPVKPQVAATELIVHDEGDFAMLFDSARFNQAQRVANLFANSTMVPAHFRGKPSDVFVALHMATRMQLDPFMLMQNTYVVYGRPGMEAKLQIALVNSRGPFKGPIRWEWAGDNKDRTRSCTAYAIHKVSGEQHEFTVDWKMVQAEKWDKKEGSKWLTMPDLMFMYRSASFLIKTTCPEVTMGLPTVDELQDMDVINIEPSAEVPLADPKETQSEKLKRELRERKPRSDKGQPRKAPESPQTPPPPEHGTSPQVSPEPATTVVESSPRDASEEILAELRKMPDDLLKTGYQFLNIGPLVPLEELDEQTADDLLVWSREQ